VRAARAGIGIIDAAGTRAVFYRNATRTIETVLDFKGRTPDRKIQELLAALKPAAA
jgi:hypothetical protein